MRTPRIIRMLADTLALAVVAALAAGWLLRTAPGAEVDARRADPRYSAESLEKLTASRQAERSGVGRSAEWFLRALRGDFGRSEISGLPVSEILAERVPVTLATVLIGATGGFLLAMSAAAVGTSIVTPFARIAASAPFLTLLAVPSGLIALLAVFLRVPVEIAVAVAVAPRTYFYAAEVFGARSGSDWILAAHAAGLPPLRVFLRHLVPATASETAALGGLAIVNALAVTIPAEVLTGRPGLGQLAWQSAMERDLPVVLAVTLVMLVMARGVTLISALPPRQAGAAV